MSEDKEGIHVIALHQGEENGDIEEEIGDRDSGELFEKLMDRIMDALEVVESQIFSLPCNTKTNVDKTPKQIKNGRIKMKKLKKQKKKTSDDDAELDVYDPSDSEVKSVSNESTKRRSLRIRKQKRKRSESMGPDDGSDDSEKVNKRKSVRLKKRSKKEESLNESEESAAPRDLNQNRMSEDSMSSNEEKEEEEDAEEIILEKPKRKKRKMSALKKKQADLRQMKRQFTKLWIDKEYVDAMMLAKDEYSLKKKQINQWIEDMYDYDL